MNVIVTPIWTLIKDATPAELKHATDILQVSNPHYFGAQRRGAYAPKKLSLMRGRAFPTGYLSVLEKKLGQISHKVTIIKDTRVTLPWAEPRADMIQLPDGKVIADEQLVAVRKALVNRASHTRAITAWGKTESMLLKYACLKEGAGGVRAILLVPRKGLHKQALERIRDELKGEPLYQIRGTKVHLPDKGLVVTTFATLVNRLGIQVESNGRRKGPRKKAPAVADPDVVEWLKGVQLLLVDECHRSTGPTALPVIQAIPATYRMGVSATPSLTGDTWRNALMKGFIGQRGFWANEKKALENKRVAAVHVFFRKIGEQDPLPFAEAADFRSAYLESIVNYPPFYQQIAEDLDWTYREGLPSVLMVDWTSHGLKMQQILQGVFPDRRIDIIHSKLDDAAFKKTMEDFKSEECRILIATPVLNEGINIPNISAIFQCGTVKSAHRMLQQAGRGNRAKKDRANVLYLIWYLHMRHAFLKRHAIKAIEVFSKQSTYTLHGTDPLEVISDPTQGD